MIIRRLIHWAASALAFLAVAHLLPGFHVQDLDTALVVSLLYGLASSIASIALLPFAYTIFILVPRPIWKLGCLLLVNSALLLMCTHAVAGFQVSSCSMAAAGALLLSAMTWIIEKLLP